MQLRLAFAARRECGIAGRALASVALLAGALLAGGLADAGCTRQAPPAEDVHVEWRVDPSPASVGPASLHLTLADGAREPVPGARLRVDGHMTHPGMAPVTAEAREVAPGSYAADLTFTMAGDWVLVVEGTLPDGRRLRRELSVPGVRASR